MQTENRFGHYFLVEVGIYLLNLIKAAGKSHQNSPLLLISIVKHIEGAKSALYPGTLIEFKVSEEGMVPEVELVC